MFARSLGRRVSTNDEFLLVYAFELNPCAASTPRFVNRVALFANNSLETATLHFFEQWFRLFPNRARVTDWIACVRAEVFENIFPRLTLPSDQGFAFELNQFICR